MYSISTHPYKYVSYLHTLNYTYINMCKVYEYFVNIYVYHIYIYIYTYIYTYTYTETYLSQKWPRVLQHRQLQLNLRLGVSIDIVYVYREGEGETQTERERDGQRERERRTERERERDLRHKWSRVLQQRRLLVHRWLHHVPARLYLGSRRGCVRENTQVRKGRGGELGYLSGELDGWIGRDISLAN